MKIRILIVDDEKPARERLRTLLASIEDVEIVAEAANANDAIEAIGQYQPDLLFLDIQMPGRTGFDVLRAISPEILPCTIFTTAYDAYAVEAFNVRALDYLLKPFTADRLNQAVTRARESLAQPRAEADPRVEDLLKTAPAPRQCLERILVKLNDRYLVVRRNEMEWVEAAANYVVLHTSSGNHVLRKALSALEAELPPQEFFRASRSAIINLAHVTEIQLTPAGEHTIVLRSGTKVPLTRGLRELQERLQFLR